MLLCLAIPAWSLVGTMRGHRAVSVSLCLMCHCQKHSTGSGFCRRAMGRRELAAELRVLPIIGVSAPPGTLSFHRAALGIWHQCCRSWAVLQQCLSFPLYPLADPVLSTAILQTDVWFCRGGFRGRSLSSKALNQLPPTPPSSAASGFLPAEQPSGCVLIPTVDVQQLWDAVPPHTPLPPFPLQ